MAPNKPAAPTDWGVINMRQREAVLTYALEQELQIHATSYTPPTSGAPGQTINIPLRNVGLVKGFTVLVRGRVRSPDATVQTLQAFGPANFFSSVLLTDLQNQTRINTTGAHLHNVATARRQAVFGGAFANDSPTTIGNTYPVIRAPTTVSGTTPQDFFMAYEVPLAYSDTDLRGAIYANVLNATWNLALTVNPNFGVSSTANGVQAVYKSAGAASAILVDWTIEVYQHFLEQLPVDNTNGQTIVPMLDTSVMYRLESTVQAGLVANQEQSVPYANFRKFLSTFAIYDNAGVLNAGTDINYFAMQTANTTALFKRTPQMMALTTRQRIGDDFQPGVYYFDHRRRPVETSAFGNVQLSFSPSAVTNSTSQLLVWYEYMADMNVLTQAGSIQN